LPAEPETGQLVDPAFGVASVVIPANFVVPFDRCLQVLAHQPNGAVDGRLRTLESGHQLLTADWRAARAEDAIKTIDAVELIQLGSPLVLSNMTHDTEA